MPYSDLVFRYAWRPYQERVLEAVDRHLTDRKLHVVAAPGSGKTTLGLEIFRRLGKPALALSPTRTIRDQWIERLGDFVPDSRPPGWASTDLQRISRFTSITYQAIHTLHREERSEPPEESDDADPEPTDAPPSPAEQSNLVGLLKSAGIGTLILDEAHHLRAEWWKALSNVVEQLPALTIVSLTATPPYDVVGHEWARYQELCGTIDEEISVPELVRAGTLCPHQDFVWTVAPLPSERVLIEQHDAAVTSLCATLARDSVFTQSVLGHPLIASPEPDIELLLDQPETVMALLVFLRANEHQIPQKVLEPLELDAEDIPPSDRRWWQVLLKSYLFDNHWAMTEAQVDHRKTIASQLRADHLLWRRELRLMDSRPVKSQLTLSSAKTAACLQIHATERANRGSGLRQVILTDFIREKDMYELRAASTLPLGAWPVFQALAGSLGPDNARDIALLTGRLVIVHQDLVAAVRTALPGEQLSVSPLDALRAFVRIDASRARLVQAVTALLGKGEIRTIVGTRSLLGEGWDAPAVNSLVLLSFVGSFMLTNQMRGRAIRIDRSVPDKVASIWHVVAVAPELPSGFADLGELAARFKTFVGLSERDDVIESGINRLKLPYLDSWNRFVALHSQSLNDNEYMLRRLVQLRDIAARWRRAIDKGEALHVAPTLKSERPPTFAPIWFRRTLLYFVLQIVSGFLLTFWWLFLQGAGPLKKAPEGLPIVALLAGIGATLFVLPKLFKALWMWWRHLPVDGTVQQIALALRDSLCQTELISGTASRFPIVTTKHSDGSISLCMTGGSFFERSMFADCLHEILGPIRSPRYILTRYKGIARRGRRDYHAVPQLLGARKAFGEILEKAWLRRVGPTELIHVRGSNGRGELLKARSRAFSTAMAGATERLDQWQ